MNLKLSKPIRKGLLAILLVALVALILYTMQCEVVEAQAPNPFLAASSRLTSAYPGLSAPRIERLAPPSGKFDEYASSRVGEALKESVFVAREGDQLRPVLLSQNPELHAAYRELLSSIVQPNDSVYILEWSVGTSTFRNLALADEKGQPKFEPVLYTTPEREDMSPLRAGNYETTPGLATFLLPIALQRTASAGLPRQIRVYNFLRQEVVSIQLTAFRPNPAREFSSGIQFNTQPLWQVEGEPKATTYRAQRRRCIDVTLQARWYSHLPDLQVGTTTKIGGAGLKLWQSQRLLGLSECA